MLGKRVASLMSDARWQLEVARLLEEAAEALRSRRHRRAMVALGTAIAYVERARDEGDEFAEQLAALTGTQASDDPTQRFTFQPGELEALQVTSEKK